MEHGIFGIDLGTTYSCIAYVDQYGKAMTIRNADGQMTTPSVVYFESNEKQIVGEEAKSMMVLEPENTVSFIKREMGTEFRRTIHGTTYSPQEISAKILKKVVGDANAALQEQGILKEGEEIKKVVITCPAYFGMAEKDATRSAGEIAGLEVLDIINEPTAAAINYGVMNTGTRKNVLVYDLGGGTFDVTIISIDGNTINVVCTGGDPKLGGKDWDNRLKDEAVDRWKKENDTEEDISEDLETLSDLMDRAEKAKKTLSTKEKVSFPINHEGDRMKLELTRAEYDTLTKRLLERTLELTDDCLKSAAQKGIGRDQIDEILLVGGSSRMPQVREAVERKYGIKASLFDPDEAVAKGAALYAQAINQYQIVIEELARKTGQSKEEIEQKSRSGKLDLQSEAKKANLRSELMIEGKLEIKNVSSRTYGIEVLRNDKPVVSNFIYQNDTLPKSMEKIVSTRYTGSGISIKLYESLSGDEIIENFGLATQMTVFEMDFVREVPAGTDVRIVLTLDNSGLIMIDAEELLYHSKLNASFQIKNSLSESEMAAAKSRSERAYIE